MRARPPRIPSESDKSPSLAQASFRAPTQGLVTNALLSEGAGAPICRNFWPSRYGLEPRGGLQEMCYLPPLNPLQKIKTLFQFRATGEFFAATDDQIFRFTAASSGMISASGFDLITNGDWSTYETSTSGGSFLIVCNGLDFPRRYNGTSWSATGFTGPSTLNSLSFIWGYRTRLMFVQKDTMTFWYGGPDSISGALSSQNLGSIFRNGGALLAGGTWSSDSGDGLDDRCVFITTAGEVAIFEGNPADASWTKVGVFDLGVALGRKSLVNLSGDLCIATADGIIPISGLVGKDPTDLRSVALTEAITPTWRRAVETGAREWRITKWPRGGMLIAAPLAETGEAQSLYAANMANRAWTEITGWAVTDIEALGDNLYVGTADGRILRAWTGGSDAGAPYVCQVQFPFDPLGDPVSQKMAGHVRSIWRTKSTILPKVSLARDFSDRFPSPPNASGAPVSTDSKWDTSDWDVTDWGRGDDQFTLHAKWRGAAGRGHVFAPQIQLTCSSAASVRALLERVDVTYVMGGAVA